MAEHDITGRSLLRGPRHGQTPVAAMKANWEIAGRVGQPRSAHSNRCCVVSLRKIGQQTVSRQICVDYRQWRHLHRARLQSMLNVPSPGGFVELLNSKTFQGILQSQMFWQGDTSFQWLGIDELRNCWTTVLRPRLPISTTTRTSSSLPPVRVSIFQHSLPRTARPARSPVAPEFSR